MYFTFLLIVLLLAASVHGALMKERTIPRTAHAVLLYILVGYCGIPMLAVSLWAIVSPEGVAASLASLPPVNSWPSSHTPTSECRFSRS